MRSIYNWSNTLFLFALSLSRIFNYDKQLRLILNWSFLYFFLLGHLLLQQVFFSSQSLLQLLYATFIFKYIHLGGRLKLYSFFFFSCLFPLLPQKILFILHFYRKVSIPPFIFPDILSSLQGYLQVTSHLSQEKK